MATSSLMRYSVRAGTLGDGVSVAYAKDGAIRLIGPRGQNPTLPGPADLLTAAFAACVLKNVERISELLPFAYRSASIEVTAERQDQPTKRSPRSNTGSRSSPTSRPGGSGCSTRTSNTTERSSTPWLRCAR